MAEARAGRQQRCLDGDRYEVAAAEPAGVAGKGEGRRHRGVALGNDAALHAGEGHWRCGGDLVALKLRREPDGASAHRDLKQQRRPRVHGARDGRPGAGENGAACIRASVGARIARAARVGRAARVAGAVEAYIGARAILVISAADERR